jgi:hypothetical protein
MIMVRTIQGDRIPIKGATEKDFKFGVDSKMAKIKSYCFNWDQILYVRIIDEEEA